MSEAIIKRHVGLPSVKDLASLTRPISIPHAKTNDAKLEALRTLARKAGAGLEFLNQISEARLVNMRNGGKLLPGLVGKGKKCTTLAHLGLNRHQSERWQTLASIPEAEWNRTIADIKGAAKCELTVSALLEIGRSEKQATTRKERQREVAKVDGVYPVIYADPPWQYEHSVSRSREIENQYPTQTLSEICSLSVDGRAIADLAPPTAILFLWATNPKLLEALSVIQAWDFTYRTNMVWVKDKIGMGYWFRQQHELLLLATRGEFPCPDPSGRISSVLAAPRTEHSRKPEEVYGLIESMSPGARRIELYRRGEKRDGWDFWGNE